MSRSWERRAGSLSLKRERRPGAGGGYLLAQGWFSRGKTGAVNVPLPLAFIANAPTLRALFPQTKNTPTMSNLKHVAVVGATGAVGVEMLRCLEERGFPVGQLTLLASARSAGKKMKFKGEDVTIKELTPDSFAGWMCSAPSS